MVGMPIVAAAVVQPPVQDHLLDGLTKVTADWVCDTTIAYENTEPLLYTLYGFNHDSVLRHHFAQQFDCPLEWWFAYNMNLYSKVAKHDLRIDLTKPPRVFRRLPTGQVVEVSATTGVFLRNRAKILDQGNRDVVARAAVADVDAVASR